MAGSWPSPARAFAFTDHSEEISVMRWGLGDVWWLMVIPIFSIALFAYGHSVRRSIVRRAGSVQLIQKLISSLSVERRLVKQLLFVLAITLIVLAALRPQYGRRPQTLRQTGVDIAIAFDISKSMLARDVHPSRLDAARTLLSQLMEELKGDRVALVPFAGIAFTQSPLTADQGAVKLYLDSLDPAQMPVGGTNLAMALEEGIKLLTGKQDRGDKSSRSRVLLLITDGEDVATDQGEAAKKAATKAAKEGITVFSIAVGTRVGEPIPVVNDDGSHAGYQKDSSGKPVYSRLNIDLLNTLTSLSDPEGKKSRRVFEFDGQQDTLSMVVDELDSLQKSALQASMRHTYNEKYQYFLFPALLLLLLESRLSERRGRGVRS
ncbi:MAG: aerotolerance regulator BatB [Myxococcales bacterium]|nr:aerotolerance regulator BatB [Myxococcales bacterium]